MMDQELPAAVVEKKGSLPKNFLHRSHWTQTTPLTNSNNSATTVVKNKTTTAPPLSPQNLTPASSPPVAAPVYGQHVTNHSILRASYGSVNNINTSHHRDLSPNSHPLKSSALPISHRPLGGSSPSHSDEVQQLRLQLEKVNQEKNALLSEKEKMKNRINNLFWKHQEMMLLAVNYANTSDDSNLPKEIRDYRGELKMHLEGEFLRVFPDSKVNNFIEKILVEPQMKLVSALCNEYSGWDSDLDEMAHALVLVFEHSGEMTQLFQWAVNKEVTSTGKSNDLFREDSVCSKIVRTYFFLVGKEYVVNLLQPTIQKICGTKESYELDPRRMQNPELRKASVKKLKKRVTTLVERIIKSADKCPIEIRLALHYIGESVRTQFPHLKSANIFIGGFLFLRFICPAIVVPSLIGITEKPGPEAQRGLILLAKVLQNMSNKMMFGEKESFMHELNETIESFTEPLDTFLANMQTLPMNICLSPKSAVSTRQKTEAINVLITFSKDRATSLDKFFGGDNQALLEIVSSSIQTKNPDYKEELAKKRPSSLSLDKLIENAEKGTTPLPGGIVSMDTDDAASESEGSVEDESSEDERVESVISSAKNESFKSLLNLWVSRSEIIKSSTLRVTSPSKVPSRPTSPFRPVATRPAESPSRVVMGPPPNTPVKDKEKEEKTLKSKIASPPSSPKMKREREPIQRANSVKRDVGFRPLPSVAAIKDLKRTSSLTHMADNRKTHASLPIEVMIDQSNNGQPLKKESSAGNRLLSMFK